MTPLLPAHACLRMLVSCRHILPEACNSALSCPAAGAGGEDLSVPAAKLFPCWRRKGAKQLNLSMEPKA